MSRPRGVVLVSRPRWVEAYRLDDLVVVRRSLVVRWSSAKCIPIIDLLDGRCSVEAEFGFVKEDGWLSGGYEHTEYTLLDQCPGVGAPHRCSLGVRRE